MKKGLLILFCFILLYSCGSSKKIYKKEIEIIRIKNDHLKLEINKLKAIIDSITVLENNIPIIDTFSTTNPNTEFFKEINSEVIMIEVKVGERISDFVKRLENKKLTSKEALIVLINKGVFNDKYNFIPAHVNGLLRFEGLIKPGIYNLTISKNDNKHFKNEIHAISIFNVLLDKSSERFNDREKIRGLTKYELITMASIIEKEDAFDTHAGIIASVFWNRNANNGRFGSCVTVEYLLGYHRPFLLFEDLDKVSNSSWSTYHHKGLPPTPICFVSDETINETINAKETDYYFFVMDWAKKIPYMAVKYEKHCDNAQIAKQSVIDVYGSSIIHQKMENYYYDYFSTINLNN